MCWTVHRRIELDRAGAHAPIGNPIQVDTSPGVSGNVSFGWFDKNAPSSAGGATITATSLSPTRLTDAGPR